MYRHRAYDLSNDIRCLSDQLLRREVRNQERLVVQLVNMGDFVSLQDATSYLHALDREWLHRHGDHIATL